jgi:hypothetical protein
VLPNQLRVAVTDIDKLPVTVMTPEQFPPKIAETLHPVSADGNM